MIKNLKVITASSYLAMFFLGVSVSLVGAVARNIGLSPTQIGLLITMQNLGFLFSVSVSGALSDTHEKPKILLVGSLILAFSFFAFYQSGLFWINLVIVGLIGVGMATYEGVTDAMLLDIHTERESLHINVNHFFVTFGSMMITVYLVFLQMNWRYAVIQSGIVVLLLAVFFGLAKLERKQLRTERYMQRLQILARERVFVVLFIATILAVGVEVGSIGILTTFLMDLRGFSQVTSKIGLTLFLACVAAGRVFVGFFTQKEQIPKLILVLLGLSFVVFTGLYSLNLGEMTYLAICLAGCVISAILPLLITLAGLLFKDAAGIALGAIKVAAGLGGILIPFLMSIIANYVSFQASLILFPVAFLLAFCVLFHELRHLKSFEAWYNISTDN